MATYSIPNATQLVTFKPDLSDRRLLGQLGHIVSLTYSFTCPGGPDQLSATLECPVTLRTQAIDPGRTVLAMRGGHVVWSGKLNEPAPAENGWQITAEGSGNFGSDFLAIYTSTWPTSEPDQVINNAITRGMNWSNPGVGSPAGIWLGQGQDSGSTTVTDLLNLVCTRGGLTWYVNPQPGGLLGNDLSVFALPTKATRLLVSTTPVARTLNGNYNTIYIRYQVTADDPTGGAAATYALTSVTNAADITAHGALETYIDLSSAGTMSQSAAQAVGNGALTQYQRVSFSGPFTVAQGRLLTTGGTPIDISTDQAGTVVKLMLTDFGYGGEVTETFPITFVVGSYSYDDQAQVATIAPFQSINTSLTSILSMENTVLTPPPTADGTTAGIGSQPMVTA